MEIKFTKDGEILTIVPEGRLDTNTSEQFKRETLEHFDGDVASIIFDFKSVDYISSVGLRVLLLVYKQLSGRSMKIINANHSVMDIMNITGLSGTFDIEGDTDK